MQAPNANSVWYIARDGQQYGPMTTGDLQAHYRAGGLLPSDHVWCAELGRWIVAAQIFTGGPPPPPPPALPTAASTAATSGDVDGVPSHATRSARSQSQEHRSATPYDAAFTDARVGSPSVVTQTLTEERSFKFSTFAFIILGLIIPLWPISLPLFWFLAYRSYVKPATRTVTVVSK